MRKPSRTKSPSSSASTASWKKGAAALDDATLAALHTLLLARLENADGQGDLHAEDAAKRLDSGHGLLAQTLRILTQPEARAEIETAVSVLARVIAAVEPRKLAKHGAPWIYFYEHFLAAYDNKLRLSYGVVYTPQEVIGCQVALVSELLADRFGKHLTFADEGVVSLDFSTGTAAYALACSPSLHQRVHSTSAAKSAKRRLAIASSRNSLRTLDSPCLSN